MNGQPVEQDEQGEEIRERVKEFYENPQDYTLQDFEEMFEDRDPFEFL
jgi:hypothetical protein